MTKKFNPNYLFTQKLIKDLIRIELAREKVNHLTLVPVVLSSLRETTKIKRTHYSTKIEGNLLSAEQIEKVIHFKRHFPGRERDEREVKGYYTALTKVEQSAEQSPVITETMIKTWHALVMNEGKNSAKPTPYRDGQNMICNSVTREIVYLPPQAKDVASLMKALVDWINDNTELPTALIAGIAHYQFATIHPYFDGNGRTARLLTTFILNSRNYDLKGIYSLEEYYINHLNGYYNALNAGSTHNYYVGRETATITKWVEYFIEGMASSCEQVIEQMTEANVKRSPDYSKIIRELELRKRKALELFQEFNIVTAAQIGKLFAFKPSTNTKLCREWVQEGFLEIVNPSNRGRTYKLADRYAILITE